MNKNITLIAEIANAHQGKPELAVDIAKAAYMSGANAISGITLVGALTLETGSDLQMILAFSAIVFASINVFGGYLVTNRMLRMFKKK